MTLGHQGSHLVATLAARANAGLCVPREQELDLVEELAENSVIVSNRFGRQRHMCFAAFA